MGHHIISKQESILSLVAVITITLQNTPLSQLQIQSKLVPNNLEIDFQKSIKQQQRAQTPPRVRTMSSYGVMDARL